MTKHADKAKDLLFGLDLKGAWLLSVTAGHWQAESQEFVQAADLTNDRVMSEMPERMLAVKPSRAKVRWHACPVPADSDPGNPS